MSFVKYSINVPTTLHLMGGWLEAGGVCTFESRPLYHASLCNFVSVRMLGIGPGSWEPRSRARRVSALEWACRALHQIDL
jgi:hypothetical protein